jgi:hypothetical protein
MWLTSLRRYKQSWKFFVPLISDVRGERTALFAPLAFHALWLRISAEIG